MITRRAVVAGIAGLFCAPAIVRASSLMPIAVWRPIAPANLVLPPPWSWVDELAPFSREAIQRAIEKDMMLFGHAVYETAPDGELLRHIPIADMVDPGDLVGGVLRFPAPIADRNVMVYRGRMPLPGSVPGRPVKRFRSRTIFDDNRIGEVDGPLPDNVVVVEGGTVDIKW